MSWVVRMFKDYIYSEAIALIKRAATNKPANEFEKIVFDAGNDLIRLFMTNLRGRNAH